ncbi:DUF6048 family protein [Olleya namhaensis]|uniref:Outer membrane protein beta-barrel domain-containing protein n=1 Tax=Olleya namhaensis TaxID=1144750 RepID=A0A1I3MEE2_9FLAO|nr:DUF6048 family protein [Olleya namhaensis]SFI95494.1 hypothetical protein SAMN05443431_103130 [Olleya namhaensis]
MKQQHTISFIISLFLCCSITLHAQEEKEEVAIKKDSIQLRYGLRLGTDASKLIRTALDDDYSGFEINGDYRLTKDLFIAGEIGNEEKTTTNDFLDVTAKGSYFKVGFDYNLYDNWAGADNMIYSGFRIGASTFSQTRTSYTVYSTNQYWQPQFSSTESIESSGLSAIWVELILGIKAEVFTNFYIGINAQLKGMITQDQPVDFENLFVPGFNKTFDSGRIGVGYGYSVSYLIPLFKKNKNSVKTKKEVDN